VPSLIEALSALVVALPLLAATLLAAAGRVLPRLVIDAVSMLTCLLVLTGSVTLLAVTGSRRVVSWLGATRRRTAPASGWSSSSTGSAPGWLP
jgi:hypothetical protein